jgi:hypothetical protein
MPAQHQDSYPGKRRTRPAVKANKYAATSWGSENLMDLTVPSGQTCQVRRPGVTGLIKAGVLDSLDSLSSIVTTDHIDRVEKGKDPHVTAEDMKALSRNKDGLLRAVELADKVTLYCVVQPPLSPIPLVRNPVTGEPELDDDMRPIEIPLEGREPGHIYVDQVDLTDKMFILQFVVGGVADLEQFREGFGETLGSMDDITEVQATAE